MKNSLLTTLLMPALFATAPALNSKAQDSATLFPGDGATIHALGGFKTWTKDVNGETQTFTQTQAQLDKIIATPTNTDNIYLFPEGGWETDANKAIGIQGVYIDMGAQKEVGTVSTTWEGAAANAMDIYVMTDVPTPENIRTATPAYSGTGLGQYTQHTAKLTSYNSGRYLALVPRDATNWGWGVKIRSISATQPVETVLTSFSASPSFVLLNTPTRMTYTFRDQLGVDIERSAITSVEVVGDNAILSGDDMLTITSGNSATIKATLGNVSINSTVYAPVAPQTPNPADIKAPILVDAESAKTAVWAFGWDGGATDLGNIPFDNGSVAKSLGDVKTVFFGNSLYTGNTADTDFNPSGKGYKSLRVSIFSPRAINGSLTIQRVRYGEDQNGQDKSVSFHLEAGKWSQLSFDCSNVTNIHAMSVKLNGDNVSDLLLANIYFTPLSIEGDTEAPVIESATASCTLPMSANITVKATDNLNPTITYHLTYGDNSVSFEGPGGEETTYTVEGLLPDTEYTFTVTASDGANNSAPQDIVVTTLAEDAEFNLGTNPDGSIRYLPFSTFASNDNHGPDRITDGDFTTGFIAVNRPNGINGSSSDEDKTTFSKSRYPWVGVDMGTPHVISKLRFAPLNADKMELGMFQGANKRDFSDAVTLHMIMDQPASREWTEVEPDCSKGFRYVRYVGPDDTRSNISEIRVFGTPGAGNDDKYIQLSELPTLIVNTEDSEDPWDNVFDPDKEHKIKTQIITINDHNIFVSEPGTIKERGNGSRNFAKKPYQLKFDTKQRIMPGSVKLKKWVLLNNATDQTQLRNELAFRVSEQFGMEFTPFHQQVELVLNGQYKGIYLLADQVEVNDGRIPVDELSYADEDDVEITGGYHMEVDAYAWQEPDGAWFSTVDQDEDNVRNGNNQTSGITVTLKSPEAPEEEDVLKDGTHTFEQAMANFTKQRTYIKNYFKAMIDAIPDGTAAMAEDGEAVDPVEAYRSKLDISSLMKHILINEVCGNKDAMWSVHMYKKRGDSHIYSGPIWDFDIAFRNGAGAMDNKHITDGTWMFLTPGVASGVGPWVGSIQKMMKNDPYWEEDMSYEWNLARYNGFSADWMNEQVDDAADQIRTALPAHLKRWPIQSVREGVTVGDTYDDHINFLKDFNTASVAHVDAPTIANYDAAWTPIATGIDNVGNDRANAKVTVYSVDGRRVWSGARGAMPRLGAGVYILRGDKQTRKIIIR
ncbi:MAG: CotH kinase family protein [Bacteroidales bacterium]|nr:CotH kinase family protein [Bacteroidales bacterium]